MANDKTCICDPNENGISRLDLNIIECTTCQFGATTAKFSANLEEITVEIAGKVFIKDPFLD